MGIKTICRLSNDSDIIVNRRGLRRYDITIKNFSIRDDVIVPNTWKAKGFPDRYGNLNWSRMKDIVWELEYQGLAVPHHIKQYFDYQHFLGRAYYWLRALFH